ncbi:uncharacterized protein E0L32_003971 [Thyridium curvatum]|uniref:DUF5672 domain-containing protein n=1 Tax=Thyridium curvatum TaxID=1093900 RepID=A0A507B216_9PEZI|nr:uncharacterized protein E0L32_003971 [Thyridium curvatum]TPX16322.1 hypothetical protein E0L32_003971 [Thyridium curvatum]
MLKFAGAWDRSRDLASSIWSRTTRRMRIVGAFALFIILSLSLLASFPIHRSFSYPKIGSSGGGNGAVNWQQGVVYNESKVALLIENRANPILAPLMLHFISVVPPDWRFRFMGSNESVEFISRSAAIREHVKAGKLDLTYIPNNVTIKDQEDISSFLTTRWLYEYTLQPAEWLLVFQTDSMLCANSMNTIDDYLHYHWIGAPWGPNRYWGGNGGLSIRRVSAIVEVLREQVRTPHSEPEDVWLSERLSHRPDAVVADSEISLGFSGEGYSGKPVEIAHGKGTSLKLAAEGQLVEGIDSWREGFYEPMGYHTGASGNTLHGPIWGSPEKRAHIWKYCPEMKMTLNMDVAKYVPGNCSANWKRKKRDVARQPPVGEEEEQEEEEDKDA